MKKFSQNIAELRAKKNLTQEQLAEKVNVSRQAVYNWENGTSTPRGANLKALCEVLGVTSDQLLGKQPLDVEKKIESAIDGLKTDLKEEEIKAKKEKRKAIIIKTIKIILCLLLTVTTIHLIFSFYKFSVLTDIGTKVLKYKNRNNYYCEIQTYKNDYLQQKEEIWYKDNKYKIEKNTYDDIGKVITTITNIINLEDNTQITYNNGEYERTKEIIAKEKYENGIYMYNSFPDIIKNGLKNKLDNSLGVNLLKTKTIKDRNVYSLKINSLYVEIDKESYMPIFYTNGENNDNKRVYFKIELDCVEEKDVTI